MSIQNDKQHFPQRRGVSRREVLWGGILLPVAGAIGSTSSRVWAQGRGFDYFIGPNGNDNNPGTMEQPWSISALHGSAKPIAGRRIGLLDGNYAVPRNLVDGSWGGVSHNVGLRISQSGSSGSPTTIEAVNPRGAIITAGTGVDNNSGVLVRQTGNFVQLRNIIFAQSAGWMQLQILGDDALVDGCDFGYLNQPHLNGDNTGHIMFTLNDTPTVKRPTIRNCYFSGISNRPSGLSHNAVAVFGFSIEDMVIEHCTWVGSHFLYTKYDWIRFTFRYNHVFDSYQGVHISRSSRDSGTSSIHNNLIFSKIGGYGFESGEQAPNVDCYNNTWVLPGSEEGFCELRRLQSDSRRENRFYNNIFYRTSNPSNTSVSAYSFPVPDQSDLLALSNYNCFNHRGATRFEWCKETSGRHQECGRH
jgi:hypothetical protein